MKSTLRLVAMGVALGVTAILQSPSFAEDVRVLSQTGHRSEVAAAILIEEHGLVATGGVDRSVVIWSAQSGEVLRRLAPKDRVVWLYHEPGTTRLWVWCQERAGMLPPECFDVLTGAPITGRQPPAGIAVAPGSEPSEFHSTVRKMRNSPSADERALWVKLAPKLTEDTTGYSMTANGKYATLGFADGHAELWLAAEPRLQQTFVTKTAVVNGLACSGDGMRLASWQFYAGRWQTGRPDQPNLRFWDFPSLRVRNCEIPNTRGIVSACLTRDGKFLYAIVERPSKTDYALVEVDAETASFTRQIGASSKRPATLRLSGDDTLLAVSEYFPDNGSRVLVWDRKKNATALKDIPWRGETRWNNSNTAQSRAAFFPDGARLLFGSWEYPFISEWRAGKQLMHFGPDGAQQGNGQVLPFKILPKTSPDASDEITGQIVDVDVSADGRWIAYGATHRGMGDHEVVDLQTKTRWLGDVPGLHHVRFRPQFPHVIVAGSHGAKIIQVRRRESGAIIDQWSGTQAETDRGANTGASGWTALMESLAITADGRRVFIVQTDGSIRMLELSEAGKFGRQLELLPVGAADWCAILPNGHYAGSPAGVAGVRIVQAGITQPLAQLDVGFNRPDEVLDVLGTPADVVREARGVVERRKSKAGGNAASVTPASRLPQVRLRNIGPMPLQTDGSDLALEIEATPAAAPLARLNILVNGILWPKSTGVTFEKPALNATARTVNVPLVHGKNRVQVSTVDAKGVESPAAVVQVERTGRRQRRVLLLSVGVSNYANPDHSLNFAASDAQALEKLAAAWGDPGSDLRATVLTDSAATHDKILATATQLFQGSTADDLAVIFLSGHGVIAGPAMDQWFFCPYDHDFEVHEKRGLGYTELMAAFDGTGAHQRLLLIDSCHSGEIEDSNAGDLAPRLGARGVTRRSAGPRNASIAAALGSVQRMFRMQDVFADFRLGAGAAVIGASAAAQFALESPDLRQGVFTHSLISGLSKGEADLDRDGRVMTSELHQYLANRVLSYTEGAQQPSSRGINPESDFVLLSRPPARPPSAAPTAPSGPISSPNVATARSATAPVPNVPILPPAAPAQAPDDFVRRYFAAGATGSAERQIDFFGTEIVRYFDLKKPTPAKVQLDLNEYQTKWPIRRYAIVSSSIQPTGPGAWRAAVQLQFVAAKSPNDPNPRTGQLKNTILIGTQAGRLVVKGIWVE